MISLREITAGLYGAWQLALGKRGGLAHFDATPEGAWRSFAAGIIALPLVLFFQTQGILESEMIKASTERVLIVSALAFILDWGAYPLLVLHLAPRFGFDDKVLRYLPAFNWGRLLGVIAVSLVSLVTMGIGGGAQLLFGFIVMGALIVYFWWVAKAALEISNGQAGFLVGIDLVITYFISAWAVRLLL